jgi:hypothetical protein
VDATRGDHVTRGSKMARLLLIAGALLMMTAFVAFAVSLNRQALWQVVRGCVADFKLTTAPYPCLAVNLSGGEERGYVVLRPPLMHDLILSTTRQIVGIEDQFLRLPDARPISTLHGAPDRFLPTQEGVRRIATRWRSSSTPPLNEPRTSSTSTLVAFFQPFSGLSQQPRGVVRVTAIRGRVARQTLSQAMDYAVRARHSANAAVRLCL